jgi:Hypothetical protein (DUF2513)
MLDRDVRPAEGLTGNASGVRSRGMERDMDCIRDLLMAVAKDDLSTWEAKYSDFRIKAYHVQLLLDAGFATGRVQWLEQGNRQVAGPYFIWRLTWAGEEFRKSIEKDSVWEKAKQDVMKAGASWTVELLKEWLKIELSRHIPGLGALFQGPSGS